MTALKFVDGSETAIEGLLLPFGGPAYLGGKDLSREYFSKSTDFCLDWYEGGARPLLWHHGLDASVKTAPIGKITAIEMRDDGGWMQAQLDKHSQYYAEVSQLIKKQAVGLSSGAMAHLVEVDGKSGEIKRWPTTEGSITPTPCNPMALVDFAAVTKHYKSADIPLPGPLKAAMDAKEENALSDSDFAYIDADGGRHLPIHDAAHVRAAMARFDQEKSFDAAKDPKAARQGAARKILVAAKRLDIEVSPDSAVSEAAGAKATKALMEGDDSSGGFVAEGAADRSEYAGQAHTESRNHTHKHADGMEHQHAHRHDAGDPSHDTSTHPHAVGMPMTKAAPTSDDGERSYEDIRDDISALLNPSAPFGRDCYTYIVATFPDHVIACRCEPGDADTYWRISYTLGSDLEPVLGDVVQVDQVWEPRAAKATATPLTLNAISASRQAAALAHEAKALGERRASDYRPLSAPNYQAIAAAKAGLFAAAEQCAAVLATSDDRQQQQAKAAALESPESLEVRLAILRLAAGLLANPAA